MDQQRHGDDEVYRLPERQGATISVLEASSARASCAELTIGGRTMERATMPMAVELLATLG
jgi:hypothetical protein